ncbi:hypothetical protein Tco_0670916, partial [Tanacetum coccineum]
GRSILHPHIELTPRWWPKPFLHSFSLVSLRRRSPRFFSGFDRCSRKIFELEAKDRCHDEGLFGVNGIYNSEKVLKMLDFESESVECTFVLHQPDADESQGEHLGFFGKLNGVSIALVAGSGVISKSTDRIFVSHGGTGYSLKDKIEAKPVKTESGIKKNAKNQGQRCKKN